MQVPVKNCFFDNRKGDFDFSDPTINHHFDLNTPPLLFNLFTCLLSPNITHRKGNFALHNQLLVFYADDDDDSIIEVLSISNSHIQPIFPGEINSCYGAFGFQITKNGISYVFCTESERVAEEWINALKKVCILSSFHEDYSAMKVIGKGGFAMVYLVEAISDNTTYAVKAFSKAEMIMLNKRKAKLALINEVEMMRRVNHDNFVKLYEVHESENSIYLVMELIKGKTLHDTIKRSIFKKKLSSSKIRHYMHSIITAVNYLHSQGIMHRDLKPANILVEKGDKIKITDFGLASLINKKNHIFKKCGTPGYMAPEVFRFNERMLSTDYDSGCDIFSIGCIFFEMLFGRPLFNTKNFDEVIKQNREFTSAHEGIIAARKDLASSSGKYDKVALNLLIQMLEYDPNRRITAYEALSHTYFTSATLRVEKLGSNEGNALSPNMKNSQMGLITPSPRQNKEKFADSFKDLSSCSDSFVLQGPNKFMEKDSLYLDVGKGDSLKKTEDSMSSIPNNPFSLKDVNISNKRRTHSNSFSIHHKPTFQKGITQNKSFLNIVYNKSPMCRTSFFKKPDNAKNTENEKPLHYFGTARQSQDAQEESMNMVNESSEVTDCMEDGKIHVDHIGHFSRMTLPSKMARMKERTNTMRIN